MMTAPMSERPVAAAQPPKGRRISKLTRRAILAAPLPALGVTALALWATEPFTGTASAAVPGPAVPGRSKVSWLSAPPPTASSRGATAGAAWVETAG